MAYEIIKRLEEGFGKKLIQLKEGLTEREVTIGQKHKVFEDSFDVKQYIIANFYYKRYSPYI